MNLYVGNLASDVTEDDLRQVFEAFGQVESINIIKDRYSGASRGFGFIKMPSKEEAEKAVEEAQGMELKGQTIKVSEAHQQGAGRNRDRGRGGRFGDRGGPRGSGRGGRPGGRGGN